LVPLEKIKGGKEHRETNGRPRDRCHNGGHYSALIAGCVFVSAKCLSVSKHIMLFA